MNEGGLVTVENRFVAKWVHTNRLFREQHLILESG